MEENASQQQGQPVEQVTRTPVVEPSNKPRQKDPKNVAAGKALAMKNKEAREAAAKLSETPKDSQAFSLSYDNILKASALVGAGFTLWHGWAAVSGEMKKRFESEAAAKKSPPAEDEEPVEITPHTPKQDPKPNVRIDMD